MSQISNETKNHCMRLPYSYDLITHDRYLYQGQEMDDEVKGEGNSVNYKYRMHDPRLGRFFAIDPLVKKYPWNSVYAFSENKVIAWVELEGLESYFAADGTKIGQIGNNTQVMLVDAENIESVKEYINLALIHSKNAEKIESGLQNGLYKTDDEIQNAHNQLISERGWEGAAGASANSKSTDVGMTEQELYLRASLDVLQSGEGGTGPQRYSKLYGGDVAPSLKKFPGAGRSNTASGAYQLMIRTWNSHKDKVGAIDFSPENQDQIAISVLKNQKVYNNILSGDFKTAVSVLKGSVWTSLQKGDPVSKFKEYIKKELAGVTLVKTSKGELIK